MSKVISCIVPNATKAEEAVTRLQAAGFSNSEISVLFSKRDEHHFNTDKNANVTSEDRSRLTLEKNTKAPEGAATGGILGGLIGLGIPELEAKQYEKKLKEGNSLVSIHADDADRRKRARDIFKECNGQDITETRDLAA